MTKRFKAILGAGVAVAMLGAAIPTIAADMGAVKERQAAMKSNSKNNKIIQAAARGKADAKKAAKAAQQIVMVADKLPTLFPMGTSSKDMPKNTRAKPAIWADMGKFKAAAGRLKSAAMQVASAGDAASLKAAAKKLRGACGGCHKAFRGPKPKK